MKYLILVVFVLLVGCKSNRSEYHRGYFNAMAIIQKRGLVKDGIDRTDWPYWEECERSYLQKIDLYNDWDSSYGLFDNKYIKGEHALSIIGDYDTSMQKLRTSIRFLDSNLKYGLMAKEMEIKMSEAKADYYRTEDEKYYRRFYKYRDLQWKYVGLANQYYDSSHAIK